MTESHSADRNVVLITVDSLRADYCYSADVPTPAMDGLADAGIRFETAIAPGPATYESMPAMFTGIQPGAADVQGGINKQDRITTHLRAHRSLPERFRERGYTTVGVTPNPFTSRRFGFDTGFDRFVDFFDSSGFGSGFGRRIVSRWADGEFVGGLRFAANMVGLGDVSVRCSEVVSRGLSELQDVSEPFFLWLMFLDPHWPYRPPRRYRGDTGLVGAYRSNWRASNFSDSTPTDRDTEALRELYRGTIRSVDDCIATLRDQLASYDPVTIVHSDHGEAFGEHGRFGHGGALYEENVHVPLIIGGVDDQPNVRSPISLRTLPRLVADSSDGTVAPATYTSDWTYATSESGSLCIRGDQWKYYLSEGESDHGRLYNLRSDPNERAGTEVELNALRTQHRSQLAETARLEAATRNGLDLHRL